MDYQKRCAELEAENKRLREALKNIAEFLPSEQLQQHLLNSTANADERRHKQEKWKLMQIAKAALTERARGKGY